MSKTAGDIIAAKRKKFSLNQLEDITGMNRSSVLRYQRNEARIPEEVAEKLARTFFKRKSDVDGFIALCQKGYKFTEKKIEYARKRRTERTRASREFSGEIRVAQVASNTTAKVQGNMIVFPRNEPITSGDIQFIIAIVSKKSGATVCTLTPNKGITVHSDSGYTLHEISPKDFLIFNRKLAVGKFALLDIMKKTIEKSDVFSFGTGDTGNPNERFVIIGITDLEAEEERLKSISQHFDSADGSNIQEALDTTIAHLRFWKARPDDFKKRKKDLLREIGSFCRRIAALSSE